MTSPFAEPPTHIELTVVDGAAFADDDAELQDLFAFASAHGGSGLIYASRRAECERIADALSEPGALTPACTTRASQMTGAAACRAIGWRATRA